MSRRILQVNELIRKELGEAMLENIDFPKGSLCTILDVETSPDLRSAKVWVSIFPEKFTAKIVEMLNKKAGFLQSIAYKKLSLKPLPKFRFVADKTEAQARDIESLLDKIKKEE